MQYLKNKIMRKLIFVCIVFFVSQHTILAQSGLPLKKITIFKNSTCMVTKEGQLKAKDGIIRFPVPTQALWGTYWLNGAKENTVKSVIFKYDTLKTKSRAKNIGQILQANAGKQVSVSFSKGDKIDRTLTGKIADYMNESALLKLKLDNGRTDFIETHNIYQLEFADDNNATLTNDSIVKMATVKTEKNSESVKLQEYYMQLGMNWIPSYFLKLVNDKEAYLEMKATIENSAEEISDVETEVVVGAPQIYFGSKLDPITTLGLTSLSSTSTIANDRFDNNMLSNAAYAQQMQTVGGYASPSRDASQFEASYTTEGEKNNDLYYYNLGKISLPKNNKGNYSIFASTLGYKDKYEAVVPDRVNYASYLYCDNTENIYEVFHSVELKNSTTFPFTTASVMVITDKDQFLAQDLLKYTPTGAVTTIKLSKAIDIILKNTEEEVTRVDNFKKIAKTTYSKVTLKGNITVENLQQKDVVVDVTKNLNGTVTNGNNGKIKKQKQYGNANPGSEVKWEVSLKAGERKSLQYDYEVLFVPYSY